MNKLDKVLAGLFVANAATLPFIVGKQREPLKPEVAGIAAAINLAFAAALIRRSRK